MDSVTVPSATFAVSSAITWWEPRFPSYTANTQYPASLWSSSAVTYATVAPVLGSIFFSSVLVTFPPYASTSVIAQFYSLAISFYSTSIAYTGTSTFHTATGYISFEATVDSVGRVDVKGWAPGIEITIDPQGSARATVHADGSISAAAAPEAAGHKNLAGDAAVSLAAEITSYASVSLRGAAEISFSIGYEAFASVTLRCNGSIELPTDAQANGRTTVHVVSAVTLAPNVAAAGKVPLWGNSSIKVELLGVAAYANVATKVGKTHNLQFPIIIDAYGHDAIFHGVASFTVSPTFDGTGAVDILRGYGAPAVAVALSGVGRTVPRVVGAAILFTPSIGATANINPLKANVIVDVPMSVDGVASVIYHRSWSLIYTLLEVTSTATTYKWPIISFATSYSSFLYNEVVSSYQGMMVTTFRSRYGALAEHKLISPYHVLATLQQSFSSSYATSAEVQQIVVLKYYLDVLVFSEVTLVLSYSLAEAIPLAPPVPPGYVPLPPVPVT